MKSVSLFLIAFMAGCASSQPKVGLAARTLRTYQVGKTTFADFAKDASLVLVERPAPNFQSQNSDLKAQPWSEKEVKPQTEKVYQASHGSAWKIYGTGTDVSLSSGRWSSRSRFVVGDVAKPIFVLTFDGGDHLIDISPVP
jgi:hypothetical protein